MNKNKYFQKLQANYFFTDIMTKGRKYAEAHPDTRVLSLGIGDVTRPLPQQVIAAMHNAVEDMAHEETFHGYCLEEGNPILRKAIIENDYLPRGINLQLDEVFVSDGAGSDLGNTSELFDKNNRVAVLDPVYPAYVDTSVMAGRAGELVGGKWSDIVYLPCVRENGFVPDLPRKKVDIIYLCFPNNPTGTTLTRPQLQRFVDYALRHDSIIIFDAAYETFIEGDDIPHSIYELEGAERVAIEIRSYSKTAGFTGVRCGYTIVPRQTGLQQMWHRRQCTKYNGTSYISQQGALATYTPEGKQQVRDNIMYYKHNARNILNSLQGMGFEVYGGIHSPYIWMRTPDGMSSWQFFDLLLEKCQVICTPGVGFGSAGEGYVRFTAFATHQTTDEALERMKRL